MATNRIVTLKQMTHLKGFFAFMRRKGVYHSFIHEYCTYRGLPDDEFMKDFCKWYVNIVSANIDLTYSSILMNAFQWADTEAGWNFWSKFYVISKAQDESQNR